MSKYEKSAFNQWHKQIFMQEPPKLVKTNFFRNEKLLDSSLDRIKLFNDSQELANKLREFYLKIRDKDKTCLAYYLSECADHIDGQYKLLLDLKKSIGIRKKENKS
jgi:hypothetical protein